MSPRRDPDAHLGPRARAANREERVDFSRWFAIAYSLMAVGFVFIAASDPDVVGVVLAVAWVLLAGAWVWRYRRIKRAALSARAAEDNA